MRARVGCPVLTVDSRVCHALTPPQLRGDDRFAMVSWRRMFQLLVTVVRQYMPGAWLVSRGAEPGIWCGAVHACWSRLCASACWVHGQGNFYVPRVVC